ncbi:hypothetical protein N7474_000590 [Penicillium riverlandense]|uniref:uncharacterized protein n=1 Tax=Penicillium riverlandense TaxID=1903569 RepID=UPI002546A38F|nr:uncharacterized protein N7474_000590 [Penicillium riverlandense]KAJ5832279.1 hypothetical protein N7474_000590 [Penicillium riverlandense]
MKTFSGNYTLPPDGVNFVSSPNVRGTLDILWSCLSVLLICTWSIIHPAVPFQTSPQRKIQKFNRAAVRLFWKFSWMLLNLLAPEWSLAKAWADYQSVSSLEDGFKKFQEQDGVPWSRAHIHLANMGGFAIRFSSSSMPAPSDDKNPNVSALRSKTDDPSNGYHFTSARASFVATREDSNAAVETELSGSCNNTTQLNRSNSAPVSSSGRPESSINNNLINVQSSPDIVSLEKCVTVGQTQKVDEQNTLPQDVKDKLQLLDRLFGKFDIEKRVRDSSYYHGLLPWVPDKQNRDAFREALETVDMAFFPSSWEKARFRNSAGVWFGNLFVLQGNLWVLDAKQLLLARELGIIEQLPCMSDDELADRNKADQLVKIFAVLQIIWFLIQTITRLVRHLATSQLEILTLSFAVSTVFTYLLLLEKPKDVHTSVILSATRYATKQELSRVAVAGPGCYIFPRSDLWVPSNSLHAIGTSQRADNATLANGAAFSVLILGLIHCVAWDFVFPTLIERVLWQASSIITATAIPVMYLLSKITSLTFSHFSKWLPRAFNQQSMLVTVMSNNVAGLFFFVFFAARLFAAVEALRSLAFLPSGAFSTTWTDSIPHIG